jgi:hypothetical protein
VDVVVAGAAGTGSLMRVSCSGDGSGRVYWKPAWHVLVELDQVELLLCNAHHVKNLPGRKTDVADAAWLCQLLECGLLRGSFVPPREIAELRDLTVIALGWSRTGSGRPRGSRGCSRTPTSSGTQWPATCWARAPGG